MIGSFVSAGRKGCARRRPLRNWAAAGDFQRSSAAPPHQHCVRKKRAAGGAGAGRGFQKWLRQVLRCHVTDRWARSAICVTLNHTAISTHIGSECSIILISAMINTYRELILDAGDVEQRLDLLPQLPPGPGAELQVLAQVALDNLESQPMEKKWLASIAYGHVLIWSWLFYF